MLDLQLAFTDDQIKTSVDDTKASVRTLNGITTVVPVVGIVGGLLCLIAAVLLMMRAGTGGQRKAEARTKADATA